ncbi:MAG: phospholipase D-like domain-containing protein, partial [Kiritimatiellia bacterium]|nr:phospholipase D-like domain-containing protein [Kiritimatiellia bacterium]
VLSLSSILHRLTFVWVVQHILRRRREAVSAVLWILTAWFIPGLGFLLYLGFGINRVEARSWKNAASNRKLMDERQARESSNLSLSFWRSIRESVARQPEDPVAQVIDRTVAAQLTDHPLLGGNRIELLMTGDEAFPRMIEAIESARHHIHLQSFIIGQDPVGRDFMRRLAAKARSGVTVRILYDRFGSTRAVLGGLFRSHRRVPHLHLAAWTMTRLLKRQFAINLRNHRKSLIVDGRIGFMGGINLQADHTTQGGKAPIRDYHFECAGPVVSELQYTFLRDWYYLTGEDPDRLLCAEHFPALEPAGDTPIRLINGGPMTALDENSDMIFASVASSKKRNLAVTP